MLARYYDSRTATFHAADPLAGDPSDPQSWNRYPYGRNDPFDITDPSGKHWWDWLLVAAGAALGGVGAEVAIAAGSEMTVADGIVEGAMVGGLGDMAIDSRQGQMPQENMMQGQQQARRITCPPWTPIITGVGPNQARNRSPISGRVSGNGDAAINPTDFGESDYYQLAQQTGSQDPATRASANKQLAQELKDLRNAHIQITPNWGKATDPQGSQMPSANGAPGGIPTNGPMNGDDIYAPPNPGHIDQYRYKTTRQARASTRQVPVTVTLIPTGNVQCPH